MPPLDTDLLTFIRQLESEIEDTAYDPDHGGIRLNALASVVLGRFEETGLVTSFQRAFFLKKFPRGTAEVHAYAIDEEDDIIILFLFLDYHYQGDESIAAPKSEIDGAYRRLETFIRMSIAGQLDEHIEPSQQVQELVCLLKECTDRKVRIMSSVVTNGLLSERASGSGEAPDRDTWDILRLFRSFGSNVIREPINIDFANAYGSALPCLVTPPTDDGLQVFLTCIRGDVLAKLYELYRSRLLERNVRSFLQFTGKVNQGIRETILELPDRFLPYNNGIAATVSAVSARVATDGLAYLDSVSDFQIVNGGQTTASLASCARRDKSSLAGIFVQMKLTIVPPEKLDKVVPLISRYANTQNRVQEADFSANHPYHIEIEKFSRQTWTKPTQNMSRGTRWFYERSRGQYAVEKLRNTTAAGQNRFILENPKSQKFSKTDMAKYLMSWDQYPQKVSLGAQKNFMQFMHLLDDGNRPLPDEVEFKRVASLALLFKTAERLYAQLGFTGYRAQVVAYTLGMLSYRTKKYLEWDILWKNQQIPDDIIDMMKPLMITARNVILSPPGQQNITEWCKKDACWIAVLNANAQVEGLPPVSAPQTVPISEAEERLVDAVNLIPSAVWLEIASWAKRTDNLQGWQRGIAYNIGIRIARAQRPSVKQARQGKIIIADSWRAGFRHADLDANSFSRFRELDSSEKIE
jgi:hypothetical protein